MQSLDTIAAIAGQRRRTKPGIDVYEQFQWEARHIVQTSFRDSSVTFEQDGVEVPVLWTANASEILASKYLRCLSNRQDGPDVIEWVEQGKPVRGVKEHSLRQALDRIVDTITQAGIQGGYFDIEVGAAFNQELKCLMLEQRASFNTPVWFNIGVPGAPQQASACFILHVDDNIPSIQRWFQDETTVFLGGSGAGVNVSNIRSSHERLSSGLKATGPLSFMRVADTNASVLKCLAAGTLVTTAAGPQPIESLTVDTLVQTRRGLKPIQAVFSNGIKPLLRIDTDMGTTVRCTAEHKFWVRHSDGTEGWCEAGQLRTDDYLAVDVSGSECGTLQPLQPPAAQKYNWETAINPPAYLNEPLAEWLGWVCGDGTVSSTWRRDKKTNTNKSSRYIDTQIGDIDADLVAYYTGLVHQLFSPDISVFPHRKQNKADASVSMRFSSVAVERFLEINGLRKATLALNGAPSFVKASPLPVKAAFLAGLFEADGTAKKDWRVRACTVSEPLMRDAQQMLLELGIPAVLRTSQKGPGKYTKPGDQPRPIWELSVVSTLGLQRFAKLVGFRSQRKQTRLAATLRHRGEFGPDVEKQWVLPHVDKCLNEAWERTNDQALRRSLSGTCRRTNVQCTRVSLAHALNLLDRFPELRDTELERLARGDIYWTTATVTAGGTGPTYDLNIPDVHEYQVSGLVVHNSGAGQRKAAKMVVMDADHPDIMEYIWCKALEERKAAALKDAGYDTDLDGTDMISIQYQNANNSVRLTDQFMQMALDGGTWQLRARTTGEVITEIEAAKVLDAIAEAAWECADPGVQFTDTINRWHTLSDLEPIQASNPCCLVGETCVITQDGPVLIEDIAGRCETGQDLPQVTAFDETSGVFGTRTATKAWVAGWAFELVQVSTSSGGVLRCTPEHRFLVRDGSWVQAKDLQPGTDLVSAVFGMPETVVAVQLQHLDEPVPVYDLEVDGAHNFAVRTARGGAVVVHNSEYLSLDNTSCNLASINVLRYLQEDGSFDLDSYVSDCQLLALAMEILVSFSDYPTKEIKERSRRFRQLGQGQCNLGALLMSMGLPYDSDAGRNMAAGLQAVQTGAVYLTSSRIAQQGGPYEGYAETKESMQRVLGMHQAAAVSLGAAVPEVQAVPAALAQRAREIWHQVIEVSEEYGVRNSQGSVAAPTGTISFVMSADTTSIEPDFSLVKNKKMVGGGSMRMVNQSIPRALRTLGYDNKTIEGIVAFVDKEGHVRGAPGLAEEHYPVFSCAMGEDAIEPLGHVRMVAALQPFLSGAASKTVNLPDTATVADIRNVYVEAWRQGVKVVSVYRDGSKQGQPLSSGEAKKDKTAGAATAGQVPGNVPGAPGGAAAAVQPVGPVRQRLERSRHARTTRFTVGTAEGYMTVGEYPNGQPGELFLKVSKQGSALSTMMDALAISVSVGLQYGVPLATFAAKYAHMKAEPDGVTDDPDLRFATSILDYVFRRLALDYMEVDVRQALNIYTVAERSATLSSSAPQAPPAPAAGTSEPLVVPAPALTEERRAEERRPERAHADSPFCFQCGIQMIRAGTCYACSTCGNTTGCS